MAADGEVRIEVKAGTADFEKNLAKAKQEATKFDKEATEAAASALTLSKAANEAAKGAAKLKTEAQGSAKATAELRKKAAEAAKGASLLKKQTSEAAKATKALERDSKSAAKGTETLKREAAAAAKRVTSLRTATQEAAREAKVLKEATTQSAAGAAKLKIEASAAAKKARELKTGATEAAKGAKRLADKSKLAAAGVKKVERAAAKANPKLSKYKDSLRQAADNAALVTGPLGGIASRLSILSRITTKAAAITVGLSLAIAALGFGLARATREAEKFERSGLRVEAILKATGFAAGVTKNQIRDLSTEIAATTLASVAGVEAAAAKLLTFKAIQNDVFVSALKLSQDLAEVGFGSIESGATTLGKALQDPVAGLTALKRVGVDFTATQKEQIKVFVETNQLAKAQAVIIKELNSQVGGAGVKAAEGLSGAYDSLGQSVDKFFQNIGEAGVLSATTILIRGMTRAVQDLNDVFFPSDERQIQDLLGDQLDLREKLTRLERIGMSALSGPTKRRLAAINEEIGAIRNKQREEKKAQESAQESARLSTEAANRDAKLAKIIEAQRKERERLTKVRQKTKRGLEEEIQALQQLSAAFVGTSLATRDFAEAEERVTTLAKLSLDAMSAQGKEITTLIAKRTELTRAIEKEQKLRAMTVQNREQLAAAQNEIVAAQMLADAVGKGKDEIRKASVASRAYLIEQEMLTEAFRDQQALSSEQVVAIRTQAKALAEAAVQLGEVEAAQQKATAAEEEANTRRLEFQETLATGLTDAVLEAESFESALKKMILQLSKAIIEAKILQAIQFSMGTDQTGGVTGGGNALGGLLGAAFTGLSSVFAPGGAPPASPVPQLSSVMASRLHRGGIGGIDGQPINVPSTTFIAAPRFHDGLKPDEFPAILQKGEEIIPKDQVGGPARQSRPININVTTPDADSFRASRRHLSRQIKQATAAT